jgi:hypothetical protein
MRVEISTLRRTVCALLVGLLLWAGMGDVAFAHKGRQGRGDRGRHTGWTRGRHVGWARHHNDDRRLRRRAFQRRFRDERRALRRQRLAERRALLRNRARGDRVAFIGPPVRVFNRRQRLERRQFRLRQRRERREFRELRHNRN